jgi:hypothetical protein
LSAGGNWCQARTVPKGRKRSVPRKHTAARTTDWLRTQRKARDWPISPLDLATRCSSLWAWRKTSRYRKPACLAVARYSWPCETRQGVAGTDSCRARRGRAGRQLRSSRAPLAGRTPTAHRSPRREAGRVKGADHRGGGRTAERRVWPGLHRQEPPAHDPIHRSLLRPTGKLSTH